MPGAGRTDSGFGSRLNTPTWSRCEALIKAFEEAWRAGRAPAIGDYLHAEGSERWELLVELVHVELELRLRGGELVRVESYLETHPELASDRQVMLSLVAAEMELRCTFDDRVNLDEYRQRFPDYEQELLERFVTRAGETKGPLPTVPPAPAERPFVPGYEIIEQLGRGGMGVVYKARDSSLGRLVALKFLPEEYTNDSDRLARFLREARTASGLNHPQICTVHALGEHEGRPFIVMEFIEGVTLQPMIARRPSLAEAVRLIGQAARALAAAHAAGVVHRDVKPDNIMVRADGYVKVLDFGLARRLPTTRSAPDSGRDTDPGAVMGTAAYMSPEQARGDPAGSPSDIFSLGVVLYQLVTGQHPFDADSTVGMLSAIMNHLQVAPSRLRPEVPAALDGLIEAMLHKDARLRPTAAEVEAALATVTGPAPPRLARAARPRPIVSREPELAILRAALADADSGRGALVCVAGEPGIGKTTLVETFLGELTAPGSSCLVARGHCSERLAGAEAYMPVIDALGELLRGEAGEATARLLQVVAPAWHAWLRQAPAAVFSGAASQPAMLREFRRFLEEASRRGPVVLFLDDIHWADISTVDLLAHLGRHCREMRVLVLAAYRQTELLLKPHPFHHVKLELQSKGCCTELPLGFLTREDVERYIALAFQDHALPDELADLIHSRTEGNPLFMADLLRHLREGGVIAEIDGRWSLARALPDLRRELPESVRGMIRRELERLDEGDRRLLSAASVQGSEFDSGALAAALGLDAADVEERLQVLDRVYGLVRLVRECELPDRTLTLRYAFVHALYQRALFVDLTPSRRAALAVALAQALQQQHGETAAVTAELACLYEVGRDFARAARQFHLAADGAARVFAHREALALARRGLRLAETLPESPERAAVELLLQTAVGLQLQVTDGFAAPAAKRAYSRARELCRGGPDAPLFPVLWGLWLFSKVRSELDHARELAHELRALAGRIGDPSLALQAQQALAVTSLCRGEPAATLRHMEQAAALYDPARHGGQSSRFGQDPGVACRAFGAVALWLLGYPDEARRQSREALRLSHELSQPSSQTLALHFASMLHQLCRDDSAASVCAETCGLMAGEHGLSFWLAGGSVMSGWAQAAGGQAVEGTARLREGLKAWEATGSVTYRTYYLGLLAEVLARQGLLEEAESARTEALALARQTGEGLYEAELHRLGGENLLHGPVEPRLAERAEDHFRQALEVARRQGAKSLELRAAMSLARLQRVSKRAGEGRAALAATHAWFTEGHDTRDLREARALLDAHG